VTFCAAQGVVTADQVAIVTESEVEVEVVSDMQSDVGPSHQLA